MNSLDERATTSKSDIEIARECGGENFQETRHNFASAEKEVVGYMMTEEQLEAFAAKIRADQKEKDAVDGSLLQEIWQAAEYVLGCCYSLPLGSDENLPAAIEMLRDSMYHEFPPEPSGQPHPEILKMLRGDKP